MNSFMKRLKVELTLTEEMLGMSPDPKIYEGFIGKNAPDAKKLKEELEALTQKMDPEEAKKFMLEKGTTVFPRDSDGCPILWDYQMKGWCKDACGMLYRVEGTLSSKFTAYKKHIDGLIFPRGIKEPRKIRLELPEGGETGQCQRPLRAHTARGEITALASSETVPAGTKISFYIDYMERKGGSAKPKTKNKKPVMDEDGNPAMSKSDVVEVVKEWLAYGEYRGLGQWRNSGKGKFTHEIEMVHD